MFRSVDWTHDMIIVKWHLFIWHERKLCALTNAPPVQSTQTGQWLSTLFHASRSYLCLVPSAIHFALSCRRRSFLQVLQSIWRIFWKMSCVSDDDKCYGENNKKITRNSNLIQAMKNNVCPKATVIRRPNSSENRIRRKIYRMFRSVDWTHDMIIVKWHLFNFSESRICPNIYRMFRSVDWTQGMIIVKWHLFIWHERKLCALTNAPPVVSVFVTFHFPQF